MATKRELAEWKHEWDRGEQPGEKRPDPDVNSALYWLPRIERLQCPTPRTEIVAYKHDDWVDHMERGIRPGAQMKAVTAAVTKASRHVGWPVFIRTDLASAKHAGPKAYLAEKPEDIARVLWQTVEDNELKFWLERAQPQAFLIREYLSLDARFRAFGGLPIAREWRYFVHGGAISCRHFYWTKDALRFWGDTGEPPTDWADMLAVMTRQRPPQAVDTLAVTAARACPAAQGWSVDFAQDVDAKWWLIDMAEASRSWHTPGCQARKEA